MIFCFNGSYSETTEVNPSEDRAFQYGDGLFESIKVENTIILNFAKHFLRLKKGLDILGMVTESNFKEKVEQNILKTCALNNLENARIKLIVWRKSGGLYTPTENSINYIINCTELKINNQEINSLGISKNIRIAKNEISNLKTLNSLPYIIASIEKKKRNLDEIILLNTSNHICECSSSNIFWSKKNIVYTPSLDSGCIAGISREVEIENLKNQNTEVIEGLFPVEVLKNAEKIWTTNTFSKRNVNQLLLDN